MDFYSQAYELLAKMSSAYAQVTGQDLRNLPYQEKLMICAYAFGLTNQARWDGDFVEHLDRDDDAIMSELITLFLDIPPSEAKHITYIASALLIEDSGISEQAFQLGLIARQDCLDGRRELIASDIQRLIRFLHDNVPAKKLEDKNTGKLAE